MELKSGQEALTTRVDDGFGSINKRLDVLFAHLGIGEAVPGSMT